MSNVIPFYHDCRPAMVNKILIDFKNLLLTYKAFHNLIFRPPPGIQAMPRPSSSSTGLLPVPTSRLSTLGTRDLNTLGTRDLNTGGARDLSTVGARDLGTVGTRDLGTMGARTLSTVGAWGSRHRGCCGSQLHCSQALVLPAPIICSMANSLYPIVLFLPPSYLGLLTVLRFLPPSDLGLLTVLRFLPPSYLGLPPFVLF